MTDLQQFIELYKAPLEGYEPGQRNPRTIDSDSAFAGLRYVQNRVSVDGEENVKLNNYAGDRKFMGEAPPWGYGPYAQLPERVAATETRELRPVAEYIFGIGGENYNNDSFELMRTAVKMHRKGGSIDDIMHTVDEQMKKSEPIQKISPALARLAAAAAGWAFSDDIVRAGGGTPRGERTAAQQSQWEAALRQQERREDEERQRQEERRTAADRRRHERSMRRSMRTRKSLDEYPAYNKLITYFSEKSDDYHRRTPIKNGLDLKKEHMPAPPRQGLVWDPVKHRWTRPENAGHTVAEVQGRKRLRGHGTGAHQRSVSGHGKGPVRHAQEGRRMRGVVDSTTSAGSRVAHPAFRFLSRRGAGSSKLQSRSNVSRWR